MKLRRRYWLVSLAMLLVGLSWALPQESAPRPNNVRPVDASSRDSELTRTGARRTLVVRAIERVKGAVVNIHSERPGQGRPIQGMGTGIIIDPHGYIVTNYHVVDGVSDLRCRLCDGKSHRARIVTVDKEGDLALIRIEPPGSLPIMPLGTASDLMLGETVVAIGNAFGYEGSVSMGIISAMNRDVTLNKDMWYKSLIQTDASINPGNSGGPLINIHGELVGVNVAIRDKAQGIGFAIPVDSMIRSVADMFRSRRRTYDGMVCEDRLEDSAHGPVRSVIVKHVDSNGPASSAGLQTGDVIEHLADVQILCSFDVERALLDRQQGDRLPIVVRRADREQNLDLILSSHERSAQLTLANELIWTKLGVRLMPVSVDKLINQENKKLNGGLAVTVMNNDGPAARAGIHKGDILVSLNNWAMISVENVTFVLNHEKLASFSPVSFLVVRSGQIHKGTLP